MSTAASGTSSGGHDADRGWVDRGSGDMPPVLPNVIAEVTTSAAQWNFRIDELLAHLDTVAETIDFLEDRELRITLRQQLKIRRGDLLRASRDLTLQVRTLSRFAAVIPST